MSRFSRRRIVLAVAVAVTVSSCTGTDTNDGEEVALGPEPAWAIPIDKTELSATYGVPSVTPFGDILVYGNSDAARQEGISFNDAASGAMLWQLAPEQHVVSLTPKYVITLDTSPDGQGLIKVSAFDISTGDEQFSREHISPYTFYSITATDDAYFIVEGDRPNQRQLLTAVDLGTGEVRWQNPVESDSEHVAVLAPVALPSVDFSESRRQAFFKIATDSPVIYFAGESPETDDAQILDSSSGKEVATVGAHLRFGWSAWDTEQGLTVLAAAPNETNASEEHGPCTYHLHIVKPDHSEYQIASQLSSRNDDWECGSVPGSLHFTDELVLGQDENHRPELIDLGSGETLWNQDEAAMPIYASSSIMLYGEGYAQSRSPVTAVDTSTGDHLWSAEDTVGGRNVVRNDLLYTSWDYFEQDHKDGRATHAINTATGEVEWILTDTTLLAADDDYIYVLQHDRQKDQYQLAAITTDALCAFDPRTRVTCAPRRAGYERSST